MFKTIRQSFRLVGFEQLSACYQSLATAYKEHESNKDVVIAVSIEVMEKDKSRTVAQNSLYWLWVTIISSTWGMDKGDQHTQLKRNHLAKIYVRDDLEFAEMALSLKSYKQTATAAEFEPIANGVAQLMSTTKATTKQMTEYLGDIDKFCYSQGLTLPKPDDYQWIMGDTELK